MTKKFKLKINKKKRLLTDCGFVLAPNLVWFQKACFLPNT